MTEDERGDRIPERHRGNDVGTDLRVRLDLLKLFRRQRPRFGEDVIRLTYVPA